MRRTKTMMASPLLRTYLVLSLAAVSTCHGFVVVPTTVVSSVVGSFPSQQQEHPSGNRRRRVAPWWWSSSSSSTLFQAAAEETAQRGATAVTRKQLDAEQLDFLLGYMNKHHEGTLKKFATAFTPLGQEMNKMNTWSGGSMELRGCKMMDIDTLHVTLSVQVEKRGKIVDGAETVVSFPLDTNVVTGRSKYKDLPLVEYDENDCRLPLDDIVRRLNRLCWMVQDEHVTGKLIQLALQLGGKNKNSASSSNIGKIPDNLYLNQVPHNVYVRNYFYTSASRAVKDAVISCSLNRGPFCNRMQVISAFPEMNPSMDSYRIGTILEMCRDMCITLAEENVRGTYVLFRCCVILVVCRSSL
jgi:hypothetical protein